MPPLLPAPIARRPSVFRMEGIGAERPNYVNSTVGCRVAPVAEGMRRNDPMLCPGSPWADPETKLDGISLLLHRTTMIREVKKIGNSQGLILDKVLCEHLNVKPGSKIHIEMDADGLRLSNPDTLIADDEFEAAVQETFERYEDVLRKLA